MVDWNKEISFGRKKDRDEDGFEEFDTAEPAEAVELEQEPEPEPELVPQPVPEPEPENEEKPEKSSLLKKEISLSFKRKPKPPKPPKAAAGEEPKEKPAGRRRKRGSSGSSGAKRAKRVVGLKIGASQLAAARIVNNGSPELVQVAREDLDPGLVVGGELREPELLSDALRAFFRKHKLPRQGVRLGIANNRIGVRMFVRICSAARGMF